ncbi:MAG: restriction endonuclease [Ectothiorhodospiraceae bacterium AqS1]|nr:restriction endonuclease [Ectothiorhodospiraceae bacterium AqS1]
MTSIPSPANSHRRPTLAIDGERWLQSFRGIGGSTNERTVISSHTPLSGVGNSAPIIDYQNAKEIASALVMANCNSLPLDWAARLSVGGINMNFFILKQLPILPPHAYLERSGCNECYVLLVAPRVLELTYTSYELQGFARKLGYEGEPFIWNEERRHRLTCELDAIYAEMYGLCRSDLEHILDAPEPGTSFPTLKNNEIKEFGEYRTKIRVLEAFDQLQRGQNPNL